MSYFIRVPFPIQQKNLMTGESTDKPMTFQQFVCYPLLMSKQFCAGYKAQRSAAAIQEAVEKVKPGEWLKLADSDYDLLKEACDTPKGLRADGEQGYPSGAFLQTVPFQRAIMDATSEQPADYPEDVK